MAVKKLALLLLIFSPLVGMADQAAGSIQDQIKALDQEIKEFTDARDQEKMEAYIAGSRADDTMSENWMDYEEFLHEEENYNQDVKWLNEKIDELQKQRAALVAKAK